MEEAIDNDVFQRSLENKLKNPHIYKPINLEKDYGYYKMSEDSYCHIEEIFEDPIFDKTNDVNLEHIVLVCG